jgi:hypothetical protein
LQHIKKKSEIFRNGKQRLKLDLGTNLFLLLLFSKNHWLIISKREKDSAKVFSLHAIFVIVLEQ